MRNKAIIVFVVAAFANAIPGAELPPPTSSSPSPETVAQAVANNIVKSQIDALYEQLDVSFRQNLPREDLTQMVNVTHQKVGHIASVDFRSEDRGVRLAAGSRKEMWKFWYAIHSSEGIENAFLCIELVSNEGTFACSSFSVVTFANGVPPSLGPGAAPLE